jgi:hypothetical protein
MRFQVQWISRVHSPTSSKIKLRNIAIIHRGADKILTFSISPTFILIIIYHVVCQSQSYITTNDQSASLSWCLAPIWDPRQIFLLLSLITFRQLRVCLCGAPSLTRGRVCSSQLLLGIASAVFLGLSPMALMNIIFLSFIERD